MHWQHAVLIIFNVCVYIYTIINYAHSHAFWNIWMWMVINGPPWPICFPWLMTVVVMQGCHRSIGDVWMTRSSHVFARLHSSALSSLEEMHNFPCKLRAEMPSCVLRLRPAQAAPDQSASGTIETGASKCFKGRFQPPNLSHYDLAFGANFGPNPLFFLPKNLHSSVLSAPHRKTMLQS